MRKNEDLIILVIGAAVIGVVIASINTWHYRNTTTKFTLEEEQTISNSEDASFSFPISDPGRAAGATVKLTVEDIQPASEIYVNLNGERLQQLNQKQTILKIDPSRLETENDLRVYKTNIGFQKQELTSAQVSSKTNLQQVIFVFLNFISISLVFTPLGYVKYQQYIRRKKMEEEFPSFLRDVVQGTRAGMSLPQSIQNAESSNYGPLNPKIDRMSAQIDWGLPFDEVLTQFSDETGSPLIKRSVDTIIQAYTSGGNVQDVLESVGDNIRSIKQLKEERQSQLYGELVTGYVVYLIFIGILIALTTYLLPSLADASESLGGGLSILGGGAGNLQENINLYKSWFSRLVFIQAIFSGLIIGKLSEGELKAGLKHSAILFAVGYLAVTFFL